MGRPFTGKWTPEYKRSYHRKYARVRRFLYRLQHPTKKRGRKIGQVGAKKRMDLMERYDWDRTKEGEDWNED